MKALRVRYTPEAASLIRRLHPQIKRLLRDAIRRLVDSPLSGHVLQLELSSFRSYRVKNYRVLYRLNDDEQSLDVYYVGHRRDVYESFRELLIKKEPR